MQRSLASVKHVATFGSCNANNARNEDVENEAKKEFISVLCARETCGFINAKKSGFTLSCIYSSSLALTFARELYRKKVAVRKQKYLGFHCISCLQIRNHRNKGSAKWRAYEDTIMEKGLTYKSSANSVISAKHMTDYAALCFSFYVLYD